MEYFFLRLETYTTVRPTAAMRDIVVQIMIEVFSILGIVTKEIGRGSISVSHSRVDISTKVDLHAEKFFKKLVGRKDLEDVLQRLDRLQGRLTQTLTPGMLVRQMIDYFTDMLAGLFAYYCTFTTCLLTPKLGRSSNMVFSAGPDNKPQHCIGGQP